MRILVCVKQVPDTTEIKIDPVKHTLIRDGVPAIVNTFDAYALEVAARIKDSTPDTTITLLSMGPEQAKAALTECLAVGGDTAYLVTDRKFGGSDTLATSYILATAIKKIEETDGKFDIIFAGKQAIDGDTGQVGPEIACHLGYPQITYASEANIVDGKLQCKRESDKGYDVLEVAMPAVITVVKTEFEPRYPTLKSKMAAKKKPIGIITFADVESIIDATRIGLNGSPTKVKKTYTPVREINCLKIEEEDPAVAAQKALDQMNADKVL